MYRNKKIALVIPAYRERKLIGQTLMKIPAIVDRIYVVDDNSPDKQNEVIQQCALIDKRIQLIRHLRRLGPGGGIITGYLESSKNNFDITVVAGGDDQMPFHQMSRLLDPIVSGGADYVKGNRFSRGKIRETLKVMPKARIIGNLLVTALTRIASGYYRLYDAVNGYTAISKKAIDCIEWSVARKGYGYPLDFLIRLNAASLRISEVACSAVYLKGVRQSQINPLKYSFTVSLLLCRGFFWRLKTKYFTGSSKFI